MTTENIHPDWELRKAEDSILLRRKNALAPIQNAIQADTPTLTVEFDEAGARVIEPDSDLQITQEADAPDCAIKLIQFIDQQLSFAAKQSQQAESHRTPTELINTLAIYRDLPSQLQSQALSLFEQYQDQSGKQKISNLDSTAAAIILVVERLNGRRTQYADFDFQEDSLFAELTNITISELTCARQMRELQRVLPINISVLNDPAAEVDRAGTILELPTEIKQLALELADNHIGCVPEASAYKPHSIAGAAIYNAVRYYNQQGSYDADFTQAEIAAAAGCSTMSIRAHYESQWDSVTGAVIPPKIRT